MGKLIWIGLAAIVVVVVIASTVPFPWKLGTRSPVNAVQHPTETEKLAALNAKLMPPNASADERTWMNCLMSNETNLDDGQSDASTVAQAIAAGCQSFYSQAFPHLAEAGTANQMPMAIAIVLTERKLRSR